MLLRRFYLIQNSNGTLYQMLTARRCLKKNTAPKPKNKTTRVLKTDILPIKSRTASPIATPDGSRTPLQAD